jgi:hypothetical protein
MWAPKIIKIHPIANASPRLAAVGIGFQMNFFLYFIERHRRPMKLLSMKRPRPSIEIATPAASSFPEKAALVNWAP